MSCVPAHMLPSVGASRVPRWFCCNLVGAPLPRPDRDKLPPCLGCFAARGSKSLAHQRSHPVAARSRRRPSVPPQQRGRRNVEMNVEWLAAPLAVDNANSPQVSRRRLACSHRGRYPTYRWSAPSVSGHAKRGGPGLPFDRGGALPASPKPRSRKPRGYWASRRIASMASGNSTPSIRRGIRIVLVGVLELPNSAVP
jgi:hypothetical protein